MANELWKQLTDPATLKIGWNLARRDAGGNFLDFPFYADVFTISFDQNIAELSKRITTESYQWAPLNTIDVPKSTLATRPGSLPELEDRIICHAITWLLAPKVDKCLSDSVYSYRLKERPTPERMFRESDVLDIPYLKSKTISRHIDPFDPWYAAWPLFDEASTAAFREDGYEYLVVTDIAAYFENIQIPILRDLLLGIFPDEQRIINFLISALEQWAPRTDQIRGFHRGIPQGTQISSFLGNLFMLPLDRHVLEFCENREARYFRYVDDIRLFTKSYPDARKALLLIDNVIRSLHLNTQSAKTEIYSERRNKDITKRLVDPRLEELNGIVDGINKKPDGLSTAERATAKLRLTRIAHRRPASEWETTILGSQKALRGLSFRAFRRWITAYAMLSDTYFVRFLMREVKRNPDHRLTRRLIFAAKRHPNCSSIATEMLKFIKSDLNIFPHQWSELLWAIRYLSKIPDPVIEHCKSVLLNAEENYYVRMSAGMLLSRNLLPARFLDQCKGALRVEKNANVQLVLAAVLMQAGGSAARSILHMIVFHPNEKVRKLGRLFREVRYDTSQARQRLKFLFTRDGEWRLCDNGALLFSMASSDRPEILRMLIAHSSAAANNCVRRDLRILLSEIARRANRQLGTILPAPPSVHVTPAQSAANRSTVASLKDALEATARPQPPEKRLRVADLPIHDIPWDGSISLRRKDMYDDDGR